MLFSDLFRVYCTIYDKDDKWVRLGNYTGAAVVDLKEEVILEDISGGLGIIFRIKKADGTDLELTLYR